MLDIPFCRKVLEFAQNEHPDFTHNQSWFYFNQEVNGSVVGRLAHAAGLSDCGTTACLAGIAVMLAPEATVVKVDNSYGAAARINGETMEWEEAGAALMGLKAEQVCELFFCQDNQRAIDILETYIEDAETEQRKEPM